MFRVLCNLVNNKTAVTVYALPDSGAYRFAFIDTSVVVSTTKRLNIKATALQTLVFLKRYNSTTGRAITYTVCFDLEIDGYKLPNIPFLILNLGNQDAILGAR